MSSAEAIISMFPGGSVTGCPKKRAMEIIAELEPRARGFYTGVLGYIEPSGDSDMAIIIRSLIKKNDCVYLNVGGGIVYDSKMNREWKETFDKAAPFFAKIWHHTLFTLYSHRSMNTIHFTVVMMMGMMREDHQTAAG